MNKPPHSPFFVGTTLEKPLLICYSHLRWDFVFQRPQHLLSRAAQSYRVYFIEEPVFEREACASLTVSEKDSGVQVVVPRLPRGLTVDECTFFQRSLLNALLAGETERPRVGWYYSPMALAFSSHIRHEACIYDCMDELSGFHGASPELPVYEDELMRAADVVFTGGQSLYEAKRSLHANIHALPSSIDADHFGQARAAGLSEPEDLAGIPHPRVCFFGVIDERMDLGLVRRVAELRPDLQLVMIGPVVKIDEESLPRLPNVHWLGGKSYTDLPRYLAHVDAGWMPFALNDATRFISPTKTPEFLAAGVPVVSTPIRDVVRPYGEAGLVEIAETPEQMQDRIDAILGLDRAPWLAAVDRHLSSMSWDRTWRQMDTLIRKAAAMRTARRPGLPVTTPLPRFGSRAAQHTA